MNDTFFDDIGRKITKGKSVKGIVKGILNNCSYRIYNKSCIKLPQIKDNSLGLTVLSLIGMLLIIICMLKKAKK